MRRVEGNRKIENMENVRDARKMERAEGRKRQKRRLVKTVRASLTVEAALLLPGILSVFLFFLSFLQVIRAEQQIYYTAAELVEETAACGYMLKYVSQETEALWESDGEYFEAADFAADILQGAGNALWFQSLMKTKLADAEYMDSLVGGGVGGIDFWGSEAYAEDEMTAICMDFKISFPVFGKLLPKLSFQKNVVMRSFSGVGEFEHGAEEETDETEEEDENEGYVFVTETGTVYHVRESCTYIRLSVEQTAGSTVSEKRNQYGGKYYPCESCMKDGVVPEKVWITKTGTRCHTKRDCSKIKRTVKKIPISEASGYRPCSRCAKES